MATVQMQAFQLTFLILKKKKNFSELRYVNLNDHLLSVSFF